MLIARCHEGSAHQGHADRVRGLMCGGRGHGDAALVFSEAGQVCVRKDAQSANRSWKRQTQMLSYVPWKAGEKRKLDGEFADIACPISKYHLKAFTNSPPDGKRKPNKTTRPPHESEEGQCDVPQDLGIGQQWLH